MAQNFKHVSHIKSSLPREVAEGEFYGLTPTADESSPVKINIAKRPTSDKLINGEIAVNYLKGHETLTIKNTEEEIVGFVNENEFYDAQEIIAGAISSLDSRISDSSEQVDNLATSVDSLATSVDERFETLDEGIEDLEHVVSSSLNDLNDRISDSSEQVDNLATSVDERFETLDESINDIELVVSSSLNDLNDRIENLDSVNEEVSALKATIKAFSNVISKGHDYVDLGLPSGTLWATINVGATSETGYGLYFQWGDTQGYTAEQVGSGEGQKFFGWDDYKWTENGGSTFTKYNATDGKTVLEAADDAAVANWGGLWHIPTVEQCVELFNTAYVTNQWVTNYNESGINGRLFTSVSNGNTIFIPAAGYLTTGTEKTVADYGFVWSSSLGTVQDANGETFYFSNSQASVYSAAFRSFGQSVRPVIG